MIYDISPVNNYVGNNSTTTFDFDFYIESADELKVYLYSSNGSKTLLVNEVDYSINELRNTEGSYITYPIAASTHSVLSDEERISLQMNLPLSQETQYNNSSLLNLSALEHSFDYLTRLIQIVARKIELCIKSEEGSEVSPSEIIDNVITMGSSILAQIDNMEDDLEDIQELADNATDMYNTVISQAETITNLQEAINTLTTSKANASGDNLSASVKAIDGQWVFPSLGITKFYLDNTLTSAQNVDLSSFLPDDNYKYEVMFDAEFNHTGSGGNTLYVMVKDFNDYDTPIPMLYSSSSAPNQHASRIMPVGSERKLKFKTSTTGAATATIGVIAYRRIGTNT